MALYPLTQKQKAVFFFNVVSASLWFCCLGRFLILLPLVGNDFLPGGIADFFHVVSVLPLVGYFVVSLLAKNTHLANNLWSLFNGIRMVWICYGVIFPHPKIAKHTSYSFLILTWCIQNVVDSFYYSFKVKTKSSPGWLFWLHHHHFYLTFPVAFISEIILVFLSLAFVTSEWHEAVLKATVLSYVPVGYFSFGYLQTRKTQKYDEFMEKRRQGRSAGSLSSQSQPLAAVLSSLAQVSSVASLSQTNLAQPSGSDLTST